MCRAVWVLGSSPAPRPSPASPHTCPHRPHSCLETLRDLLARSTPATPRRLLVSKLSRNGGGAAAAASLQFFLGWDLDALYRGGDVWVREDLRQRLPAGPLPGPSHVALRRLATQRASPVRPAPSCLDRCGPCSDVTPRVPHPLPEPRALRDFLYCSGPRALALPGNWERNSKGAQMSLSFK